MLRKHRPIDVPEDNPLANDRLQRKKGVETLSGLIANAQTPFVIAVTGSWGTGKTTFVKMLEATLRKQGHVCIHHNAWESDFADDPLVGLIEEIARAITSATVPEHATASVRRRIRQTKSKTKDLLHAAGPVLLQIATKGALTSDVMKHFAEILGSSGDDIAKAVSKYAEESLGRYRKAKESIGNLQDQLAELVRQISTPEAGTKTPLVFVIDELDRCRPTYAIQLLERVKHIFNVEGLVFVLAIDREQLCHSIQAVYGSEFDAKGYLRRFIDLGYRLEALKIEEFVWSIWDQMELDQVCQRHGEIEGGKQSFSEVFCPVAEAFGKSLREIEQTLTQVNVIVRTLERANWARLLELGSVAALRLSVPSLLQEFVDGRKSANDVLQALEARPGGQEWLEKMGSVTFEALLVTSSRVEGECRRKIAALEAPATTGSYEAQKTNRQAELLKWIKALQSFQTQSGINHVAHHLKLFELAKGFSTVE
jgi:energy-coupling factor transporter ATP-binding protein EcfA2